MRTRDEIDRELLRTPGATSIFAKCPVDLAANEWYAATDPTNPQTLLDRHQEAPEI